VNVAFARCGARPVVVVDRQWQPEFRKVYLIGLDGREYSRDVMLIQAVNVEENAMMVIDERGEEE
jgi:hypothetical protein